MSWQDVMIKHFGHKWLKSEYYIREVGMLAENVVDQDVLICTLEEKLRIATEALEEIKAYSIRDYRSTDSEHMIRIVLKASRKMSELESRSDDDRRSEKRDKGEAI